MENKSSFGIIGVVLLGIILFIIFKPLNETDPSKIDITIKFLRHFLIWIFLGLGALATLLIFLLIKSSKNTKGEAGASGLENQIRSALSSIRQQKFKSESKINRLKEWANDAIMTTYGTLFGNKFLKSDLYEKYPEIKTEYSGKLSSAQVEKTDQIVNSCINHMLTEKSKIETLDKLQKEHEFLKDKLKEAKLQDRSNKKLDKHVNRLNAADSDLSGEATIAKADYTLEDLKQEVEMKQEYVKQLEELSLKYGDNIQGAEVADYQTQLNELKNKL